ncbi:hypothetical protein ABZ858_08655 [Streptomyces sp. NPDC047017]|uniref:hypothetical protein n=1 Tax=Streptomyces sp. NPDC047017 TaxID=3155024 RepID=UPI0033D589D9
MKKRSMLALASLATGFVVAAVSPSHAADRGALGELGVQDTVGTVDHLVSHDSFAMDEDAAPGHTG